MIMKRILKLLPILLLVVVVSTSCTSVRVAADYDKNANFNEYNSFAFYKPGIDKAEISDLDKRRILRAIESELLAKGFSKSDNPDLLVSIFTKAEKRVDVYNIDLIDAKKKELIWQGQGVGYLTKNIEKKDERIREFVKKIMERYPPINE